ncbi:MAG: ABC transporter ATP-binding protein [Aigarchaeota archaeon]|nr:ABC transporter ATP-binding protein [Candidatus Calditenuis fumarioli]
MRISLERLEKSYGGRKVLKGIDLDIGSGELFCVLGPSGSGKTTLLKLIAGLERPDSGRILFNGDDVTEVPAGERGVSMVFQNLALFPNMTAFENVAFPLRVRRFSEEEVKRRVREISELLRIEGLLDRKVETLSGGERQRVALARALVYEPRVFLLDEPLTGLEPQLRREIREEVKRIQRVTKITTVYVTHDQGEAFALADRLALLRDGEVQEVGDPISVYTRPRNLWVAEFLSDTPLNVFRGRVEGRMVHVEGLGCALDAPKGVEDGQRLIVVFRPEDLKICEETPHLPTGTVRRIEFVGDRAVYEVDIGTTSIYIKEFKPQWFPKLYGRVSIRYNPEVVLFFNEAGEAL